MSTVNGTLKPQDERIRRLAEVQLDIQRLVEACTERGIPGVDESTIDRVVKILRADAYSLTAEQEEELWRLRVLLSQLARPATCTGLRLLSMLEGAEREKGDPAKAISQFKRWLGQFVVLLLLTVALVHGYSLVGKALLDRANQNSMALGAIFTSKGSLDSSDLVSGCIESLHTLGQLRSWSHAGLDGSRGTAESKACEQPNSDSSHPTNVAVFVDRVRSEVANPMRAERARAEVILKVVTTFLLPMLYGALGAFVFALRQIANRVEQGTLRTVFRFRYRVRLFLGAIFGLAIATFLDIRSVVAMPQAIFEPSLAMAFVAGYSIEAVFSVLDFIILHLRDAVTGSEERRANTGVRSEKD